VGEGQQPQGRPAEQQGAHFVPRVQGLMLR
jgi:hypothetical protein